ncbi:hydantoinase B/oxoprolinase family protein [Pleionea sp. CnH1-48]|uniref:hydantoinase B/oxoprolinase family protein n=1 Tax=Pleionea sp. CnH1-48 TaxID=2954494 RepID=UPI0020970570|nr:hydantoinase B/oxoprolinase family protein [Pleionea sp. CnH1-48]MCO7224705.1 hydantoinase B/oxoprolinase family protein [Pleionea sp. CnH1-48]
MSKKAWRFWVDRGGTFTDIIAVDHASRLHSLKLLSEDPAHYEDAIVEGIQRLHNHQDTIDDIRIGTTVATNALLERKGAKTLLLITQGLGDLLTIRSQHRSHLFNQNIIKPKPLYSAVIEIEERMSAEGEPEISLNNAHLPPTLKRYVNDGYDSVAITLMHSVKNPTHELALAQMAKAAGFTQISLSHQISPLPRLLPRAETTVVDAYLSPILKQYTQRLEQQLSAKQLLFMQSSGDLTTASEFDGKNAILSGPAGGIVAMARTAQQAGFDKVVGFDMGGTSTDVSLFTHELDKTLDNEIAGVHVRAPMLSVHTVAAGGGSKLWFDGARLRVGPESAGAHPGPVCYRKKGHLTVTDINVLCGKIRAEYFPQVFGASGDQPLDVQATHRAFEQLTTQVNSATQQTLSTHELANGFMKIAINNMANAIRTISTQKGIELFDFVINAFGGAGGQHACLVADELGIKQIFLHAQSSLLSAYGMGCGYKGVETTLPLNEGLSAQTLGTISEHITPVLKQHAAKLEHHSNTQTTIKLGLKYSGSDTLIMVPLSDQNQIEQSFLQQHQKRFGFVDHNGKLIIEQIHIQSTLPEPLLDTSETLQAETLPPNIHSVWFTDEWVDTPFYALDNLPSHSQIKGPAVGYNTNTTLVIEPGWQATKKPGGHWVLTREDARAKPDANDTTLDPIRLEIFNNRFMHIAEQMGMVLKQTARSVNIKERLDFSCALFDGQGNLIANAPHMPVHLGSMSSSVRHVIQHNSIVNEGDVWMLNSPYHGGTHLPDITVISPVFVDNQCQYWVASRGHHADIGGTTPGSMPAHSQHIDEEGVLIENFHLVKQHKLQQRALEEQLKGHPFPVRNFQQTLADLKAQIAANQCGINEIKSAVEYFGNQTVSAYMTYVQDNAAEMIKQAISQLKDGHFQYPMDCGAVIRVAIRIENDSITMDFTGTSPQQDNNFNAPLSVTRAAALYVLRSLIDDDIPLNEGCLKPLKLVVPENSLLNPEYPAAVVAGNVETSQCLTDAIWGALGLQAGAQGTMNNLIFGNQEYQYYETIAGGSGAGKNHNGTDAVQTHMTNSRMTDPEILEQRFPVCLEEFSVRKNSGGEGKFNGGNGILRRIRFNEPMTVSILSNNRTHQPFGMMGGGSGHPGENKIIRQNGEEMPVASASEVSVEKNDRIEIKTPGGGGYGSPQ